jgi:putative transposase
MIISVMAPLPHLLPLILRPAKYSRAAKNRHRHQEYHHATHKHPTVKRWLAAHPRTRVHYTPTYASLLNQVEIWFNLITQRATRRGTFKSVKDLIVKIEQFATHYNRDSCPFVWTATVDSILEKRKRLCHRISETRH